MDRAGPKSCFTALNYLPLARLFYTVKTECTNCSYQGPSTEVGRSVNRSQVRVSCETRRPCAASVRQQSLSCCRIFPQLVFATRGCLSHCVSKTGLLTHLVRKLRPLWDIGGVDQDRGLPQWGWGMLLQPQGPHQSYSLLKGGCDEKSLTKVSRS